VQEGGAYVQCAEIKVRGEAALRTYARYYEAARFCAFSLREFLYTASITISRVVIEVPPPIGQTSAGLTGLGFVLLEVLQEALLGGPIVLLSPQSIGNWVKAIAFKGADRCAIAEHIVGRIRETRSLLIEREDLLRENNDVATAFLFYVIECLARAGHAKFTISNLIGG